jgi:F-type H+-transporting ATPase subunit b
LDLTAVFQEAITLIEEQLNSVMARPDILVLNLMALVVLVIIVRHFFWAKVTAYLDARKDALAKVMAEADAERAKAQSMQEKSHLDYLSMKKETEELKDRLTKEAYLKYEELVQEAKDEARRRLDQAKRDIDAEISQANEEIMASIREIAFTAAEKIVRREIDQALHDDVIDEIVKAAMDA